MPDPLGSLPPPPDDGGLAGALGWLLTVIATLYIALREAALRWARNEPRNATQESRAMNEEVRRDIARLESTLLGLKEEVHECSERISTVEGELKWIRSRS